MAESEFIQKLKSKTVIGHNTFTVEIRYSFENSKILGVGTFGAVVLAFDEILKKEVAIKRMRPYAEDETTAKLTLREIRCLRVTNTHPNVNTF
jgi:serine/threonine protein kinase